MPPLNVPSMPSLLALQLWYPKHPGTTHPMSQHRRILVQYQCLGAGPQGSATGPPNPEYHWTGEWCLLLACTIHYWTRILIVGYIGHYW